MKGSDKIICELSFPVPHTCGELCNKKWQKHTFRTKNLDNRLEEYKICFDGFLWKKTEKQKWKKISYDGLVKFYDNVDGKSENYRVEWQVVFRDGKCGRLQLMKWEKLT